MKNTFLFPVSCKRIGWIIAIPAMIVGVLMLFSGPMWDLLGGYLDEVVLVVLTVALLLVAFSRERTEDEYTSYLRTRSLVFAVVGNYLIIIVAACIWFTVDYLYFLVINLFTPLLIYIVHFNLSLQNLKRLLPNE